jgi:hypothetical protein
MEVKGTAVLPLREFVRDRFESQYEEWLNALSPQSRQIIEWCLVGEWYPLAAAFIEPTRKVCDLFYSGDEKTAWQIGRFSADYALKGFFRIFVRFGSPHFILSRGTHIFSQYYRPSEMRITEQTKKQCLVQIIRFDGLHRLVELRIGGWIERAVEISGKKVLRCEITRSLTQGAPMTEYAVEWEE